MCADLGLFGDYADEDASHGHRKPNEQNFPEMMRVRLSNPPQKNADTLGRNLLVVSSCGMCGSTDMQERIDALPPVGNMLRINTELMNRAMALLTDKQDVFLRFMWTTAYGAFSPNANNSCL